VEKEKEKEKGEEGVEVPKAFEYDDDIQTGKKPEK
jgi:hypothetical protein